MKYCKNCGMLLEDTFEHCIRGGQDVTIPDNVVEIDSFAFFGCYYLESVTIPDSVTWMGGNVFVFCYLCHTVYGGKML